MDLYWISSFFLCSRIIFKSQYSRWLACFSGEGNGNPFCCLENPMEGGAWWAAVHAVAELGTTEQLHFHFSLSCLGEGHGNPLQCSCLENPRDGGAWWAAVYGVSQSRTRMNRFSSSSSSSSMLFYSTRINFKSSKKALLIETLYIMITPY